MDRYHNKNKSINCLLKDDFVINRLMARSLIRERNTYQEGKPRGNLALPNFAFERTRTRSNPTKLRPDRAKEIGRRMDRGRL